MSGNDELDKQLARLLEPEPEYSHDFWRWNQMQEEWQPLSFLSDDRDCFRAVDKMVQKGWVFWCDYSLGEESAPRWCATFLNWPADVSVHVYATNRSEALVKAMIAALEAE
jgi:hypothetical protein